MLRPYNKAEVSFDIIKEIGYEGQNSKVYLAKDNNLEADIVIKEIGKKKFSGRDEYFKEAQVLYLGRHPNVVPVQYACEDNDNIYIAMPYFQNGSLSQLIDSRFLTIREVVRFSSQFLTGVHNIHAKGLIHFDIKPNNILISDRNEALLSDFGLARHTDTFGLAGIDTMYLRQRPPESLDKDVFTLSFDIYQIGITLYRMVNGNKAFNKQFSKYGVFKNFDRNSFRYDVRNGKFPDRKFFYPHVPKKLRNIIKKCLEVDCSRRYKAVNEILNDLADIDGVEIDWQYEESGGNRIWKKSCEGKKYELVVSSDKKSVAKKISGSGTARKIKDYCLGSITDKDVQSFLGSY